MEIANLYSNAFIGSEHKYVLTPTNDLWEKWIHNSEGCTRMFVRIICPSGISKIISVGDPVYSEDFTNSMFIPLWMLDSLAYTGDGSQCNYELVSYHSLEKATKIVVKPVDNLIHNVDVKQELEYAFSQLGVLTKDETILVNIHELGGQPTFIHIHHLEPSNTVFLDGDSIPIEFETSVYDASGSLPPTTERPPTPIPRQPPTLPIPDLPTILQPPPQDDHQSSMIPPINSIRNRTYNSSNSSNSSFVPFSGKGYSLK